MRSSWVVIAVMTITSSMFGDDCQEFADRVAAVPSRGVSRVVIYGGAGFLHVEGRSDATEIRAEGRACAPIEHLLVAMLLKATRAGDVVTIKATVPREQKTFLEAAPRLDFTVIVPASVSVEIGDTGGDLVVSGVARVRAAVASGNVEIHQIAGDVDLLDKNGNVRVSDVSGNLTLRLKPTAHLTYVRVAGRVSRD